MSEQLDDVQKAEPTAPAPSAETKQPQSSTEDVTNSVEQKVPLERFREVDREKNYYKDLYEQVTNEQPKETTPTALYGTEQYSEAKAWQDYTVNVAQKAVEKQFKLERIKKDLDEVSKKDDFALVAPKMQTMLKENPSLNVQDAYELSKLRSGLYEEQIKEAITKRNEESSVSKAAQETVDQVYPQPEVNVGKILNEKDAKGNFKFSLEEIKKMIGNPR